MQIKSDDSFSEFVITEHLHEWANAIYSHNLMPPEYWVEEGRKIELHASLAPTQDIES